ncbi:uncharacterized protein LOC123192401 [Mangifera indica]|uniref:uncharacterized protein LOC123192401 n=1 Tax=Mangifera indica TaxID=29780 RepID=UPI001CFAF9A4|nr:uncharacterized protein LOC123192401 [Mangifera indica]
MHATFVPSGSTAATGVPLDPSTCLGMPTVSQVHTGGDRTHPDGLTFFFGDALQNFEHNLSKPSSSASTVAKSRLYFDLNQSPGVNETSAASSFFMDPYQCLGRDEGCHNKIEEVKRQHSLDSLGTADLIKASKRPKFVSNLPAEIEKFQNKEPRLFKDVEKPFTGRGISIDAEQEVPAELDLSLHL